MGEATIRRAVADGVKFEHFRIEIPARVNEDRSIEWKTNPETTEDPDWPL